MEASFPPSDRHIPWQKTAEEEKLDHFRSCSALSWDSFPKYLHNFCFIKCSQGFLQLVEHLAFAVPGSPQRAASFPDGLLPTLSTPSSCRLQNIWPDGNVGRSGERLHLSHIVHWMGSEYPSPKIGKFLKTRDREELMQEHTLLAFLLKKALQDSQVITLKL